ncbi:hypothetical protein I7I50_02855 [Histoplasma capsulatum G186AR]|nr:hypothetical protein I7I52_00479 [Histoplasma capsulatum]QSS71856.1 hypothetical protein I7I50_02855 [Histoplasma capsulatum G186AR]
MVKHMDWRPESIHEAALDVGKRRWRTLDASYLPRRRSPRNPHLPRTALDLLFTARCGQPLSACWNTYTNEPQVKTGRQDQRFIKSTSSKDVHAIVLLYLLKDQLAGLRPAHPPCHGLGPDRTVVHLHTQAEN